MTCEKIVIDFSLQALAEPWQRDTLFLLLQTLKLFYLRYILKWLSASVWLQVSTERPGLVSQYGESAAISGKACLGRRGAPGILMLLNPVPRAQLWALIPL